jgi:hypothetical protein
MLQSGSAVSTACASPRATTKCRTGVLLGCSSACSNSSKHACSFLPRLRRSIISNSLDTSSSVVGCAAFMAYYNSCEVVARDPSTLHVCGIRFPTLAMFFSSASCALRACMRSFLLSCLTSYASCEALSRLVQRSSSTCSFSSTAAIRALL